MNYMTLIQPINTELTHRRQWPNIKVQYNGTANCDIKSESRVFIYFVFIILSFFLFSKFIFHDCFSVKNVKDLSKFC